MAPGLNIAIRAPLDDYQRDMDRAKSVTASATREMAQLFIAMNRGMAAEAAAGAGGTAALWASTALRLASNAAAIKVAYTVAFTAIGSAVDAAHEKMKDMLELSARAGQVQASPALVQAFDAVTKGAGDAKAAADGTDAALKNIAESAKEVAGDSTTMFKAISEATQYIGGSKSITQALFNAPDLTAQTRVALEAMRQLEAAGQHMGAVDLGEKLFGAPFLDRVRRGKQSVDELVATIEKTLAVAQTGGDGLFSDAQVQRAGELDEKLKAAWNTIQQNLKPSWEGVENIALGIKGVWADIVGLLAKASGILPTIGGGASLEGLKDRRADLQNRLDQLPPDDNDPTKAYFGGARQRAALEARLRLTDQQIEAATPPSPTDPLANQPPPPFPPGAKVPTPRANPFTAKDEKPAGTQSLDQIETFINQMTKANEVLEAELKTQGLSNAEKEKAIDLAKAEAAARAAGRELTDNERAQVLSLAGAHAQLAGKLKDVEQAQRAAAEAARYFGDLAANALGDMILDGKSANDVMNQLLKTLARAALQAGFTGQGPLASILGTAPAASAGPNAVGGVAGLFGSLFGSGASAAGTAAPVNVVGAAGGMPVPTFGYAEGGVPPIGRVSLVGERGPELFVPNQVGTVVPNEIVRNMGSGDVNMTFSPTIDARGSTMTEGQFRAILEQHGQQVLRQTRAQLPDMLYNARRYSRLGGLMMR